MVFEASWTKGDLQCWRRQGRTFNTVAKAVIDWHGQGTIDYIPFPDHLKDSYQSYTQADISGLRAVGYEKEFIDVRAGVAKYLDCLNNK